MCLARRLCARLLADGACSVHAPRAASPLMKRRSSRTRPQCSMDDAEAAVATIESLIAAFGHVFVPLTICAISFRATRVS